VRALRDAGAVILGKTVTTEMGGAFPGPTTNPFDPGRTPGGSSSGSAAVIGTQVGGSLIRPASYCGNCA
jgi:Asp-tRNA(Asn)/Glu-tRNA(Gln) amidotransferase A subunit family amidase